MPYANAFHEPMNVSTDANTALESQTTAEEVEVSTRTRTANAIEEPTAYASPFLNHLTRSAIAAPVPVPDFGRSLLSRRDRDWGNEDGIAATAQIGGRARTWNDRPSVMESQATAAGTGTGSGTRRYTGTNPTTTPTEHPRVQGSIQSRRPYLADEDLHRRGVSDAAISMPDSSFMYPYTPMLNADPAAGSDLSPNIEPSDSISRRRPSQQLSVARLDRLRGLLPADAEEETIMSNSTPAGSSGPVGRDREISRDEESRRSQRAGGRSAQAANPTVEAPELDMAAPQAAIAENFRQRYRMMAVQVGLEGRADQDALVLRELDMHDEAENGPASFRGLARAYADANARGLWTREERERIRDEALVAVERERRRQGAVTVAMAGLAERDREAMAGAHRRRLYEWADEEGVDGDHNDHDEERGGFNEMNENENDTDGDENEDGWRDLEEALSSQYRRRNAPSLEFERAEADRQRAEADMSRWLTERAARRREERIAALIDGSHAQNFRLRHRASRERILRAMEGFMARERRNGAGGGGIREELREGEAEATRREVERRQGVQLHRSERVAEMMREREARRFAGANATASAHSHANANTNTKTRDMLEYLSRLRSCDPLHSDEAIKLAISLGVDTYSDQQYDLLTSMSSMPPAAYSSLLTPGTNFTGSQHAPHHDSGVQLSRDRDYLRRMVATRNRNRNQSEAHLALPMSLPVPGSMATLAHAEGFLRGHGSVNATSYHASRERELEYGQAQLRARLDSTIPTRPTPPFAPARRTHNRAPDHWPVSVTLHSVDLERLSLTGTMSANHIPDKSTTGSVEHKLDTDTDAEGSSMRSFFEGEIIDFRNVSLETETYKQEGVAVDLDIDARYWGQIGPFKEIFDSGNWKEGHGDGGGDARLASALGRKDWLEGVMREWVLMRWKERIFLPASSASSSSSSNDPSHTSSNTATANHNTWGLTISGFYYVAMKRDTGRLEGLYYDPESQPYQRLELRPEGGGGSSRDGGLRKWFPSVEFGAL